MDVGVRELKQRLSEYLDRAARGERIVVTDRGRPKALLTALPGRGGVERGVAEGWITPPAVSGHPPPAPRRHRGLTTVRQALDEDRAEP